VGVYGAYTVLKKVVGVFVRFHYLLSNKTVGIDIELQREKIIRIADKFVQETAI
jgi:hypothetical protein